MREDFLIAHVSADGSVVGIDHPTDAPWADVLRAHVVLRDHLDERIRRQSACPHRPKTEAAG